MTNFLDETGIDLFWNKIKVLVDEDHTEIIEQVNLAISTAIDGAIQEAY